MAACRHRRARNTWSGSDIATGSAIKNQQFFLLAFVGRKLFTQLAHNYFLDEKGPASRGTGVAFASTIAFGGERVTQDGSLVLALPLRTRFPAGVNP